jgi:hypothetical protein
MSAADPDARLERRYRSLLLGYPASYRQDRGAELVSTLLAAAKPGQRTPTIAEAFDLLYNGLRTRARITHRTLAGPVATDALAHAAIASLVLATAAAAAVIVGVSVLGQPFFYRNPNRAYPVAIRLGVGLVLAAFPAALVAVRANRPRGTRWLAVLGAMGSAGSAAWLAIRAVDTQTERLATLDTRRMDLESLPYESLEPSNLFGLVTLFCVPALLLIATRSSSNGQLRLGRGGIFAGLLTLLFVSLVSADPLARARMAELGPEGTSTRSAPSLHDTGLTQGVAVTLIVVAAWHFFGRRQSRNLVVAWAMMVPALGYAIGTFVTPMFFRPGISSRTEGLGPHLLEVAVVAAAVVLLGVLAVASMRRPENAGRPPERRSRWPARGSRWSA